MRSFSTAAALGAAAVLLAACAQQPQPPAQRPQVQLPIPPAPVPAQAPPPPSVPAPAATSAAAAAMTFFVTSTGLGRGADLGGLAGADRHCQTLAQSVGAGQRTWRAYLSTSAQAGSPAINARDRIGTGPWRNARGVLIADSVEHLHGASNNLNKQTALTEKGDTVSGRGDTPNLHDVLTGSRPDGTAFPAGEDRTCRNWTHSGEGAAMVGHHDRTGLDDSAAAKSWNASHPSRGCSQDALKATGGGGLLYCFAMQ